MGRWQAGTRERLQRAALELLERRRWDDVTAGDIAAAAGLTERTFYRHFADKREVVFHGQERFVEAFLDAVRGAPAGASPMAVAAAAVRGGAAFFPPGGRDRSLARQALLDANPPLAEREQHKLAGLVEQLAAAMTARGVDAAAAVLAAETAGTVFRVAFARWLAAADARPLVDVVEDVLAELRDVTARW
ncbi:TetR family transcriptional regulator [Rhodococcus aerolatus]